MARCKTGNKVAEIDLNAMMATQADLAALFEVSRGRISQLAKRGVFGKAVDGKFPVVQAVHRWLWFQFGPASVRRGYDEAPEL